VGLHRHVSRKTLRRARGFSFGGLPRTTLRLPVEAWVEGYRNGKDIVLGVSSKELFSITPSQTNKATSPVTSRRRPSGVSLGVRTSLVMRFWISCFPRSGSLVRTSQTAVMPAAGIRVSGSPKTRAVSAPAWPPVSGRGGGLRCYTAEQLVGFPKLRSRDATSRNSVVTEFR
jgi:hypothetical protein